MTPPLRLKGRHYPAALKIMACLGGHTWTLPKKRFARKTGARIMIRNKADGKKKDWTSEFQK